MPKPVCNDSGNAIDQIARRFALEGIAARPLTAFELQAYRHRDFVGGWEIVVCFEDKERKLRLLTPKDAPWVGSRVALVDTKCLEWPHVEHDGVLCIRPNNWTINPSLPAEVAIEELAMSASLIEELVESGCEIDFREEFVTYWHLNCKDHSMPIFSIAESAPPSRKLYVWYGRNFALVGDHPDDITRWLCLRFPESKRAQWEIEPAALLWLSSPPIPSEYPITSNKLLDLASKNKVDLVEIVSQDCHGDSNQCLIVLGAKSASGSGLIGVSVHPNAGRFQTRTFNRGFRDGKLPRRLRANRVFDGQCTPRTVERADPAWVHGRDQDVRQQSLQDVHVAILGCGSIGSRVAELLVSAGVGSILLIDPETLTWANTGRHVLGAEFVGKNKADSLAMQIGKRFPHMKQIRSEQRNWQDVMRNTPEILKEQSLIISTIGDWSAEAQLNSWHLSNSISTPILYGWTEAFCCAGHAVAIYPGSGCLQCGFSPDGIPAFRACDWPNGQTISREPSCGTAFQPYGPIELAHICGLVAEFAIDCLLEPMKQSTHHIWAGSQNLLSGSGGQWSEQWKQAVGGCSSSSRSIQRPWERDSACPICGKGCGV